MSDFQLTTDAKDRLLRWALIELHDIPSLTMASAAIGMAPADLRNGYFGAPKSIGEFGRCYELMMEVPELREVFPLIETACPEFKPVLDAWDELAGLFVSDRAACYNRLRELTTSSDAGNGTWRNP